MPGAKYVLPGLAPIPSTPPFTGFSLLLATITASSWRGRFLGQLKRKGLSRPVVVNIKVVRSILYHPFVRNVYRGRKGKVLAQLGRVDGVGRSVMQLAALGKPRPALVPLEPVMHCCVKTRF